MMKPSELHILLQVVLIIGISGSCRKHELRNIKPEHVQDTGSTLIISVRDPKTRTQRSFVVAGSFYPFCKKYMNLRPSLRNDDKPLPFFLNYKNARCTNKCVGVNFLGSVPKKIAEYLGLPNPELYTGHCFRRSSAILINKCW